MSPRLKSILATYGITSVISLVVTISYALSKDVFNLAGKALLRVLSDAFTIPGLLLICFGALFAVSNIGALDGLSYGIRRAVWMLIPGSNKHDKTYYEYVEERKNRKVRGFHYILIIGFVDILISIGFIIAYYH